jgi:S-adenosylmethionine:tRNA ribosyltransferase-isomerase
MSRPDLVPLRTDAYEYELPPGRIARYPAERRDESRLLVLEADPDPEDRGLPGEAGPAFHHRRFRDLPGLLREGDLLVLNDSRVFPARLRGRKATGAPSEVLLLRPVEGGDDPHRWEALVRPGSKLKPGRAVEVAPDLRVIVEDGLPGGGRIVRLETTLPVATALERHGLVPLPPYLDREAEPLDRERYQTVYARVPGSVAAPTAGLHFTPELLGAVERAGVEVARVTLHVGPGTFRPVEAAVPEEHAMHREAWEVPAEAARAVERARARGGRVWAVGTTVVRTLESAADPTGALRAGRGETDLFIVPGYRFRVVDALVTNFHLPRSTLLMLVAAFAGHRRTIAAYREAIRAEYRFYSYGDAMAVLPARTEPR